MRRLACLWMALCCGWPGPVLAHERATARLEQPAEGAVVSGRSVPIVVAAAPGGTPAEFRLLLDGKPVDEAGAVGPSALFTTFRLPAGTTRALVAPLDRPGDHTLRLEPTPHADRPETPVVRRFTSVDASGAPAPVDGGAGWSRLLVVAGGLAVAAGGVLATRRLAAGRGAGRGGTGPSGG